MNLTLTPAEMKILRWLLETVVADQEHFLEDETDAGAIREATRAKRRAERWLTKLAQPRCRIQIVARRDENGDSEIRLIPVRTARNPRKRGVRHSCAALQAQSRLPLRPQVQT